MTSPMLKRAYFLLESVIVKGGFEIDEAKKVTHGCEHALADVVSIRIQPCP